MKAAFLTEVGKFEIREVPIPDVNAGEVLVKIKSVGICGSDVHYYKSGRIGSTKATFPYIIGHECSGVIEKVGSGIDSNLVGTRVAVEPAIYCYKCRFCLEGMYNICENVEFLGTPPIQGAYSEYLVIPEKNVLAIPNEISFDDAVLLEPLAIAFHALKRSDLNPGDDVAIYGCGTVGLSILSVIRERTKGKVFAIDKLNYRLDIAREFGADYTINSDEIDPVNFILKSTHYGVQRSFEAAGSIEAMKNAADITSSGGTVILGGIPEEDNVCFDAHTSRRKELDIKFLRRSNFETVDAVKHFLKNKGIDSKIITHKIPLEEIATGFEMTKNYSNNAIKVIINP